MVFSEKKVKKKTGKDIAGIFSFLWIVQYAVPISDKHIWSCCVWFEY
jgi:hypothetical protein